jgi:membrane-bound serine protease (ClpP class)
MRTAIFYSLLQIPGLLALSLALYGLVQFDWISVPVALGIALAWCVKDALLYPLLKDAYEPARPPDSGPGGLVGMTGTTTRDLAPAGFVRVRGELWQAVATEADAIIPANCEVRVLAAEGMVLTVAALAAAETRVE